MNQDQVNTLYYRTLKQVACSRLSVVGGKQKKRASEESQE